MFGIAISSRRLAITAASLCSVLALCSVSGAIAEEPPVGDMPATGQDGGTMGGGMMGGGMMGGGMMGGGMMGGGMMGGGMMGGGMHDMQPPFLRDLDLSDAQKDEVFKVMYAQIPAMRENGKAIRKAQDALREQVMSGHFDSKAAQPLADALGKAIAAAELQRADTCAKVLALLTPEQRQQVQEEMKKRQEEGGWHRRHR